ncbi:heat shock protein HtpX [Enhydrobacter aerosaccus]|uniref:Protease HtpX homolog n=1 Tax=Enhydrobacter aerosaccus TaxID=225324 RepID=A0A1T4QK76_9HYPH|nr:M48 family metallopeptidase [Enhydrobacter aerosaccus]SKA04115.1 heat shock protein HtpX [Enhydrobacter aerosaccus]
MAGTTDFVAAQAVNRRNTLVLLVVLTALAAITGYVVGWLLEGEATDQVPMLSRVGLAAAGLMALASVGWSAISLAFGDRMVLAMAEARAIEKADAPQLYNVVEEMSLAAGVPMPRVMILETEALNAFATGTTPARGTIVVTRGLLERLNRDELQGVVAHEMAHLANLDTRYMVVVGVTVGLIALVCDMILRTMSWGGSSSGSSSGGRRDDRKDSSGAGLLIILLVVVAILAPIAARAVQMAVSRQREYLADATSVQFTRNPNGLISALTKLADAAGPFPGVSRATQHLFIVNPVQAMTAKTSSLFATHPDIASRIARLRDLGA